eukprot:262705_1
MTSVDVICLFLVLFVCTIGRSQLFTIVSPPRTVRAAACATYNKSIFIIGGFERNQFVEYNISSDVITDHGQDVLPEEVHGIAMYFSQYGNLLYMAQRDVIGVYDLSSSLFPYDASTIQKGTSNIFGASACVTASEHFLFVLGGYEGGMLTILN